MNLTERERIILQLAKQGLSDYKIARKMSMDPPNVTRSRKNARRKLMEAVIDIDWAWRLNISIPQTLAGNLMPYCFFM
jgi:transcriptional regulator